ncbi:MAG: Magnesium transporter MgtE [Tenericutes bacterium ADurb.BinA155]|nr:MAG: Magnesium transporter MgtE [Tenericutes bacterium ADurb.BinA155]
MEEPNTQTTEIKPAAPRAKITTARLENLIAKKDAKAIQKLFIKVPDIDIAEAANALTPTELIFIFRCVESKYTADFFDELDQSAKEHLVKAMTDKELVTIVNTQAADDVTDTVGEMPANLASKVLKAADKDMRKDINYLLNYKENTAGSIMTTEYIELLDNLLVDDAIDKIRDQGKDAETIYTIFVRDAKRNFVGTVDLDDLIFAKKNQTLHDIMNQDVVSCLTSTDQEEVGQMFRRYDLNALAVLNDDRRLVGIITIDDAVDVMTAEATEDIEKLGALTPAENNDGYLKTSPAKMAWRCIPWLVILLVMGTLSSLVLSQFDEKIAAVPLLASFLPVLMDGGGNSGGPDHHFDGAGSRPKGIRAQAIRQSPLERIPNRVLSWLDRGSFRNHLVPAGTIFGHRRRANPGEWGQGQRKHLLGELLELRLLPLRDHHCCRDRVRSMPYHHRRQGHRRLFALRRRRVKEGSGLDERALAHHGGRCCGFAHLLWLSRGLHHPLNEPLIICGC